MNTQTLLSIVADQREELLANDYSELCRRPEESQFDLKSNMAQVVIGVRRCGKSTLCEMFLKQKDVEFAYVNFDDDSICYGTKGQFLIGKYRAEIGECCLC